MKTTVQVSSARNAIAYAVKNLNRRSVLPVLSMLKVSANGHLDIESTDLDCIIRARIPCQSEIDGTALIAGASLKQAFGGKNGDITIETDDKGARLAGNGVQLTAATLPNDDFPPAPEKPEGCRKATFNGEKFFANLAAVSTAMSNEASRYVLNGVLLERARGENWRMVATDGRRLHLATFGSWATDTGSAEPVAVIIPAGTVDMLLAMPGIKKSPADVHFSAWIKGDSWYCSFECGDYTVISKQINGNYPHYRQVIPSDPKFAVTLDAAALADIAKQCTKVVTDKEKSASLHFHDGQLQMTAGPVESKIVVNMAADTRNVPADGFKIAFDPHFLMDMANSFKAAGKADTTAGNLQLLFDNELCPVTVYADQWQAVIMPMRLK